MPKTDSVIERVTAAIKANLAKQISGRPLHGDTESTDWHASGTGSFDLAELARVAIEAMSAPTERMHLAAVCAVQEADDHTGECWDFVDLTWRKMIDAALSENL